jgi:CBS domain-containing protein
MGEVRHMRLGELLNKKDFKYRALVTVKPQENILAAVQKLVEHDRGSLPVCDDKGELVGIITERDIVRTILAHPKDFAKTRIDDFMSKKIVVGTLEDDLDYAITVMKVQRIRHLPIMDGNRVVGMISMRDLLGVELEESKLHTRFLSDYISGGYV